MNICFNGYDEKILTFEADSTVKVGMPVKMSGNGKVTLAADGDVFIGVCASVRGDLAGVQLKGYTRLKYSGGVAVGYCKLAASATGVKSATTGHEYLVLDVDSTSSEAGIIL